MKKTGLVLTLVLLTAMLGVQAKTSDLFKLDENKMEVVMQDLNELEIFIESNNILTFNELNDANAHLVNRLSLNADLNGFERRRFGLDDMEWGSFLWGFCCWPVGPFIGIFTVLLNDNKGSNHKISYFIGLATGWILSGSAIGIYYR